MLLHLIVFIVGGSIGAVIMALFKVNKEDCSTPKVKSIYPPQIECQIHPSFICLNSSNCNGNPNICEWSVLK